MKARRTSWKPGLIHRWASVILAVVALALVACSGGGSPPTVAATVEGATIRSAEIETLVDGYLRNNPGGEKDEEILENLTRSALLHQIKLTFLEHLAAEMSTDGRHPDKPVHLPALADAKSRSDLGPEEASMARSFQAGRLNEAMAQILFPEVSISEKDLQPEYERLRVAYGDRNFWRVTAKIATFMSAEAARQLAPRVEQGEPFDRAASALGALHNEVVDITPISPLPQPVLEAVSGLAPNKPSSPIHADVRGWVVVLVERRADLPDFSLDDVRADLTRFLADRQRQSLFNDWFEKKLQAARIEVNDHYGRWDSEQAKLR